MPLPSLRLWLWLRFVVVAVVIGGGDIWAMLSGGR